MTDPVASEVISQVMLFFGGPAAVIAIASVIGAYNQWRTRRLLSLYLMARFKDDQEHQ